MKTIPAVHRAIMGQLENDFGRVIRIFPKAALRVISKCLAGVFILLDKHLGFSLLQIFVRTATWKEIEVDGQFIKPLQVWGDMVDLGTIDEGSKAEMDINVESIAPATLPKFEPLRHPSSGEIYLTTADVAIVAGLNTVPIQAVKIGKKWTLEPGLTLEFVYPKDYVDGAPYVSVITSDGEDGETEGQYRQRILNRYKKPPDGGAPAHYRKWAKSVEGIEYAYPYVGRFIPTNLELFVDTADGTAPTPAQITAVETTVEAVRPAGDRVNVLPVVYVDFVVDVKESPALPMTTEQETLIEAGIDRYFASRQPWIPRLDVYPKVNIVSLGEIQGNAMQLAATVNAIVASVSMKKGGIMLLNYTLQKGERARATVNFV